jgi:hypothetical protein
MKKSLLAIALMIGVAAFVSSCGSDPEEKTYSCSCSNSSKAPAAGLSEADKNAYITSCQALPAPASGSSLAKGQATATCN